MGRTSRNFLRAEVNDNMATQLLSLRLLAYACMAFALILAVIAMTLRLTPSEPAYVTFLFLGLIASFSANAIKELDRKITDLSSSQTRGNEPK